MQPFPDALRQDHRFGTVGEQLFDVGGLDAGLVVGTGLAPVPIAGAARIELGSLKAPWPSTSRRPQDSRAIRGERPAVVIFECSLPRSLTLFPIGRNCTISIRRPGTCAVPQRRPSRPPFRTCEDGADGCGHTRVLAVNRRDNGQMPGWLGRLRHFTPRLPERTDLRPLNGPIFRIVGRTALYGFVNETGVGSPGQPVPKAEAIM